jgi:hypothetical protein
VTFYDVDSEAPTRLHLNLPPAPCICLFTMPGKGYLKRHLSGEFRGIVKVHQLSTAT